MKWYASASLYDHGYTRFDACFTNENNTLVIIHLHITCGEVGTHEHVSVLRDNISVTKYTIPIKYWTEGHNKT